MKYTLIAISFFIAQTAIATDDFQKIAIEKRIELNIKHFKSNRSLPHAFYDQATASIPKLYPSHVFLAKRRFGQIGKVLYALVCYKETHKSSDVLITGVAVSKDNAWSFETRVEESSFVDQLLIVLEAIGQLPSNQSRNLTR